jgi:hypothetical protein
MVERIELSDVQLNSTLTPIECASIYTLKFRKPG